MSVLTRIVEFLKISATIVLVLTKVLSDISICSQLKKIEKRYSKSSAPKQPQHARKHVIK